MHQTQPVQYMTKCNYVLSAVKRNGHFFLVSRAIWLLVVWRTLRGAGNWAEAVR